MFVLLMIPIGLWWAAREPEPKPLQRPLRRDLQVHADAMNARQAVRDWYLERAVPAIRAGQPHDEYDREKERMLREVSDWEQREMRRARKHVVWWYVRETA
ncbi:hypothetical protein D6833_03670 [Candidatus Parcubacteria bacterium]|nr:MAG: hypothetical protein D6833_03670 [Candidatus Parcubacteria bacterium]